MNSDVMTIIIILWLGFLGYVAAEEARNNRKEGGLELLICSIGIFLYISLNLIYSVLIKILEHLDKIK